MKEGFFFYENFKATADTLPDDMRLKFYDSLTDYVFKEIEPTDIILKALIKAVNPVLYEETRGGAREGAGRKKKEENQNNQKNQIENFEKIEIKNNQNNQIDLQKETKKNTPLNPQKENNKNIYNTPENNKLFSCPKEEKRFKKPTLEEIRAYCQERNNDVQAERFYDFYESKGWRVGNQAMKDWMAAVRTWENKNRVENKNHSLDWL